MSWVAASDQKLGRAPSWPGDKKSCWRSRGRSRSTAAHFQARERRATRRVLVCRPRPPPQLPAKSKKSRPCSASSRLRPRARRAGRARWASSQPPRSRRLYRPCAFVLCACHPCCGGTPAASRRTTRRRRASRSRPPPARQRMRSAPAAEHAWCRAEVRFSVWRQVADRLHHVLDRQHAAKACAAPPIRALGQLQLFLRRRRRGGEPCRSPPAQPGARLAPDDSSRGGRAHARASISGDLRHRAVARLPRRCA